MSNVLPITYSQEDMLSLDAAVLIIMQNKGVSRKKAKKMLLVALQKGELTAYGMPSIDSGEIKQ